jgi:hypothetical protein
MVTVADFSIFRSREKTPKAFAVTLPPASTSHVGVLNALASSVLFTQRDWSLSSETTLRVPPPSTVNEEK